MTVRFAPTSLGSKSAALHISSSDSSVGAAFDINLTGVGTATPPVISAISTTPAAPTSADAPTVRATIQAGAGNTISSAILSYNAGGGSPITSAVFTETMAAVASVQMAGWDGTTWNTRVSELTGSVHGFVSAYRYDLNASERVSSLKMRFQFVGNGTGGPTSPSVQIDDIKVVTTSGSAPLSVTMFDDGSHSDGAAGDGIYGAQIPAQITGTLVTYTIAATDSASASTTSNASSYTVDNPPTTPVLTVTPPAGIVSNGMSGGAFTPVSGIYTLTNSGAGTLNWSVSESAQWLTLSAANGSLAAGVNTAVTATINSSANSLIAGSYSGTITFTNGTNGAGNTTRTVALTVTTGAGVNPKPIRLHFNGTAGTNYPLQYSPDLSVDSWINIGSVTHDGNFSETNANRLALPKGFYRAVIQ